MASWYKDQEESECGCVGGWMWSVYFVEGCLSKWEARRRRLLWVWVCERGQEFRERVALCVCVDGFVPVECPDEDGVG